MKKVYKKPMVYIEKFELSQNIAACGWDMNQETKETCEAWGDTSEDFFNPSISLFIDYPRCDMDGKDYEGFCYENGADDVMRMFNS